MNQVYELKVLQAQLSQQLLTLTEPSEATLMATWLLEYYLQASRTDLLLNKSVAVSAGIRQQLREAIDRLNRHEPVQYVLEEAYFYGRKFIVSPAVLIPRRETEELVAWVREEHPENGKRILDIGTGSGCIAVTLSLEMNQPTVHALDISEAAVRIATENATFHWAEVTFWIGDLLNNELTIPTPFDVIVSNPPYVRRSEAAGMSSRVVEYEPEEALFVGNHQPLLFYKTMAERCRNGGWLAGGGSMYWEINEAMGDELLQLLQKNGFQEVRLRKDMQGKPRFITGKLAE